MHSFLVTFFRFHIVLLSAMALLATVPRLELEAPELAENNSFSLFSAGLHDSISVQEESASVAWREGPAWRKIQSEREKLAPTELPEPWSAFATSSGLLVLSAPASSATRPSDASHAAPLTRWSNRSARGPPRS